jgi:crotonobetaine/carnitine-CoA ligase
VSVETDNRIPAALRELLGTADGTVAEAFLARARRDPHRPFLRWGEASWTYAQALAEAMAVAARLRALVVPEHPRVAMFLNNRPEAMWTWLGGMFAGMAVVPINRRHRGALLSDMLQRSHAAVLVADSEGLMVDVGELPSSMTRILVVDGAADAVAERRGVHVEVFPRAVRAVDPREVMAPVGGAAELACIIYTSGTTGRSKAVRIRHGQLVRGAARLVEGYGLRPDDVFHNWLPLYHVAGLLHMTMTAVLCGGCVALLPTFSTSRFREEVRQHGCTVLCGMAATLNFIGSIPPDPGDADLPLRVGIIGGIPAEIHDGLERRFGMTLGENYGMTEIDPITLPRPGHLPPRGSCGLPSPDVDVEIHDPAGRPSPPGVLGEIVVRSRVPELFMDGYEDDPVATAEVMRAGWFRTGDMGTLDGQGNLWFRGRMSHYIRHRGENVSTAELEQMMLRCEGIGECAAVGVPSAVGEEDIKLVVVRRPGIALSAEQVRAFAQGAMASFMVPRYVEFTAALPRNELGKVRIGELRGLGAGVADFGGR